MTSGNETLRAAEFVVTLNGDNHEAILKVLKQFRSIVRKERRLALALDDDDYGDSDSSDDEMDTLDSPTDADTSGPPTKKYKKSEEWKADTGSYHVPFVGTAVARGEQAECVKGEWPTGLVKAYLESSPLALELLNDDLAPDGQIHRVLLKKKKTKLSRAICKAHSLAIAELLTVAIPKHKLQEISPTEDEDEAVGSDTKVSFLKGFIKSHLQRFFTILNEETGRGRGKTGAVGGCDLLVAPVLRVLNYFAMISTSNARLVARYLDESLLDGVLRVCLRPSTNSKPPRTEAILLATRLLDANDAAVNTYICTGGSKERKVKPGILFIALREGLASQSNMKSIEDDYNDAAADMLEHLRISMFTGSKLTNPRLLFNLMARDPLQHLCRLSSHAPQLTETRKFTTVLDGKDDDETEDDTLVDLGVEARRLLFPLLSDQVISPFLPNFGSEQVARSMVRLLESPNATIELRRFLVYCTKENPCLIEDLLKLLTIPDPKNSFDYVSRASFIADLLSEGPSPLTCVSSMLGRENMCIRDILSILLPVKLKGQFLAKALQNGNNLVRIESFKLIMIILKRFTSLKFEAKNRYNWDEGIIKMLTLATFQCLPDLKVLLSLRSRFEAKSGNRCGAVLSGYLFQVIEAYITTLPSLTDRVSFDWMKLLPSKASEFNQAFPFLQVRILKCLQIIIRSCQKDLDHQLLSSKIIFEIMLSTKSKKIHSMCRMILVRLVRTALLSRVTNTYAADCIGEEVAFWTDGITSSALPAILKVFREILNNTSTQLAFLGQALKVYHLPNNMNFSNLLIAAFSMVDDCAPSFAILAGQVAARCLTGSRDPLPLAAVIMHADKVNSSVAQSQHLAPLITYARALLNFEKEDTDTRISHSATFLASFFDKDSPYSSLSSLVVGIKSFETTNTLDGKSLLCLSPMQLMIFTKILNHTFIFSSDNVDSKGRYWQIVRLIVPSLLLKYPLPAALNRKFSSLLADIYAIQNLFPCPDFDEFDMMISSCPFSASNHFTKVRISAYIDEIYKSRSTLFTNSEKRSKLLRTSLLKNNLGPKSIEKIQLSLISDARNNFSNLCLDFLNCCFRIEAEHLSEQFALENELLETAVNAWIWVGKESLNHGKLLHRKIKSIMSSMLACSLKNGTVKAACLLSLIEKYPEITVLDICLDFSTEEKHLVLAENNFLKTVLKTDSYRFMGPFLSCLQEMGPRLLNAWQMGYLDDFLSTLLRQVNSSPDTSEALSAVVGSKASDRFIGSLASTEDLDLDSITPLLDLLCTAFDTWIPSTADTDLIVRELISYFSLSCKGQNIQIYGDGVKSVCSLGIRTLDYLQASGKQHDELSKQLTSELFYFLFAALPTILKKNSSLRPTTLKSDLVLTWLIRLIEENFDHLFSRKIETPTCHKVCRVCLKHGVTAGTANDDEKVSMLSLKFVGILMKRLQNDRSVCPDSPTAKDVFDMVVSHSKFEQLFTGTEIDEHDAITVRSEVRQHVLKLMISCILMSNEDIEIESIVWKTIFSSFNAGISDTDILIRHMVSISCEDSLPFMDEFHWEGCDLDNREQLSTGKLDWLISDLDATRIRASISRFPISDRLDLDISLDDIWTAQFFDRRLGQTKQSSHPMDISNKAQQYSPAFLLPLLLKNIELGLSRNEKLTSHESLTSGTVNDKAKQEPTSPWNFSKSSVESIHQLCEKGIVSLCLASLSSLCEKVRCYAIAILGLILQASLSNYALETSSWRDRPQLAMILNSVQRSILLQKALDEDDSIVPRVAPVVATFLARAAAVLPKPDDALYVSMNRHFLKNEANHGAFQDMKRLPAFMSLFCSSSEDADQSRAERMWGLQILRDGLADASCYKLVTSCHAPELILSSFENVRLSKASDEAKGAEICLLLGALGSMIEYGEYGAHVHLIRACGLLSWMSSVCSTRSLATAFPTERSRILFCQLANSVVERVFWTPQLKSFEVIDEVCSLIQPVVSLCLIKGQTREPSRAIYEASLMTLRTIATGLRNMREENIVCPDLLPLGVSLESSLRLLAIADDSLKAQSLHTLCCLPVSLTRHLQPEMAQNFVILMLDYFSNISNHDDNESSSSGVDSDKLIVLLLQRILLLIEQCGIVLPSKKSMSGDIVTKIFALRGHERFSEVNVRRLWSQCLKLLTQNVYSGGLKIESLEDTIRKEISTKREW